MKTLSEALFSKKNIGKNALDMNPYKFFMDLDENFERTGPFVAKLLSKSTQIEDRILFICESKVDIIKILNTFHHLKVKLPVYTNHYIECARSGYFIAIFSSDSNKTEVYMYLLPIDAIKKGIYNYTFGDYEYINNPDDPKELEDIYNNFIVPKLNS